MIDSLKNPKYVTSIGVGGGLEIEVISNLLKGKNTKIIGLDLSDNALRATKEYLEIKKIDAHLIQSSAVYLPFRKEGLQIDGIVLSAIMHEIYSYVEDGKAAWKKAIQEAAESLSLEGKLLLRDFAAPDLKEDIDLKFLSGEALDFYNYYCKRFRVFSTWDKNEAEKIRDRRLDVRDYPEINQGMSRISADKAAEMMLHFNLYQINIIGGHIAPYEEKWKEIDERYLPFNPNKKENISMNINEYVKEVIECASEVLEKNNQELICLKSEKSKRPKVSENLKKHFALPIETEVKKNNYFEQVPSKMELLFTKVAKK